MCGLLGALAPHLSPIDHDIIKDLTIVSMIRGYQGAGCTFVTKTGDSQILRTTGPGSQLVLGGKFDEYAKKKKWSLLFGHTRWPTRGFIDLIDHIHPFSIDHIIGVHNGTMEHIMGRKPEKGESDSGLLYKAIAEHGIKKAIEESKGAYSLVWIDRKQKTLNFLRNWERPLFFGTLPGDDVLYWASEPKFLECVLARRVKYEIKISTYESPLDMHLVFDIQNNGAPKELGREEIRPPFISQKSATVTADSHWRPRSRYVSTSTESPFSEDGDEAFGGDCGVPFSRRPQLFQPKSEFMGHFRINKNFWVNREQMTHLLQGGCDYCTSTSELDDFLDGEVKFINQEDYLCHKCSKYEPAVKATIEYYKLPKTWPNNPKTL